MWKRYVGLAVVMMVMMEANLSAQDVDKCPVKLNPSTTVRNTVIMLTVANPPNVLEGTIQLRRSGFTDSKRVPLNTGTMAYTVPSDLPLGLYSVMVNLNNTLFTACEWLNVVPAPKWELKLFPFEPNATYDTETVWVPDKQDHNKSRELTTVRLAIRGSGFLVDTPRDNQILINGNTQPVQWDNCTTLPDVNPNNPTPNEIHGQVISSERVDLCRVPVPPNGALRIAVKQGDIATEPQWFVVYRWSTWPVAIFAAVIALALGLLVLLLVHFLNRTQPIASTYNALKVLFLDLETNTYSLSKFQFYWWTAAALFGYAYLVISKMLVQGQPWPDIPGTLPGIVAIGAGTSVGAQFVTSVRGPKGAGTEEPSLGDLVTSGGVAAPERVQMLVWTIFGVGAFCLAVLQHAPGAIRDLDPVPSGMLYMMGLSSVGYLGGKLARKPGPVINEISITPAEADDALTCAAPQPPTDVPNLSQPVAQGQSIAQTFTNVPAGSAQKAVNALLAAITVASQAKTTADAEAMVTQLTNLRSQAEVAAQSAADEFTRSDTQPESARAAEIAQHAAAALQDLSAAISATVTTILAPPMPGTAAGPKFTRILELRGRSLSSEALIEIDGVELPFRMLRTNIDGHRLPEVVIREPDDPTLARVLRLSIDPGQLEAPDFQQYKRWFGTSDTRNRKIFTLINPDGQKADMSFTVPPAAAQSSVKTGQEPTEGAPKPSGGHTSNLYYLS
jgi:hypothetical protein